MLEIGTVISTRVWKKFIRQRITTDRSSSLTVVTICLGEEDVIQE